MNTEQWKDIEGYEGLYQVSDHGRVKSLQRKGRTKEKILKPGVDKDGYHMVGLCKEGKHKTIRLHRLVAKAFVFNPDSKHYVNHLNGIKNDNLAVNLEWCTPKENIVHSFRKLNRSDNKGSNNAASRLKEEEVLKIHKLGKQGLSQRKIAEMFDVSRVTISYILNRKKWKHVKID